MRSTVSALLLAEERPVVIQADKRATTEVLVPELKRLGVVVFS